jgi:hypothetical protein
MVRRMPSKQTNGTMITKVIDSLRKADDKIYLLDNVSVHEQVAGGTRVKLWLSMKYPFADPKKDLEDDKCLSLIYDEVRPIIGAAVSWSTKLL